MQAGWRIGINNLAARRSRVTLLVLAVAFATSLSVCVAVAIASLNASLRATITDMLGNADLRIRHQTSQDFRDDVLARVQQWPEVDIVAPSFTARLGVTSTTSTTREFVNLRGVTFDVEAEIFPIDLIEGRVPAAPTECIVDPSVASMFKVGVGDRLRVDNWGADLELEVVGIENRKSLAILQEPELKAPLASVQSVAKAPDLLSVIHVRLRSGVAIDEVLTSRTSEVPPPLEMVPSDRVQSGLDQRLQATRLMYYVSTLLAFLCSAFIVLTGMTVAVTERVQELAVFRCLGAARIQLFISQLVVGAMIGLAGGVLGVPLGVFIAWALYQAFPRKYLVEGIVAAPEYLVVGLLSAVAAGLIGALIPAWAGSRTSPLEAMTIRSRRPHPRGVALAGVLSLILLAVQTLLLYQPADPERAFWLFVALGLPMFVVGWFLLGVPVMAVIGRIAGPPLARLMRVPAGLLVGSVTATPYRHGFTAGALMLGLATMVAIWSNGRNVLDDWVAPIEFPDAFVYSFTELNEDVRSYIESEPFVTTTTAVSRFTIEINDDLGATLFGPARVTFIVFEPETFFDLTALEWLEGDPEIAQRRLLEGGAIIIAREFASVRDLGVGDRVTLGPTRNQHEFEIVGVVSSPGLDIATQFFGIEREFQQQAIYSVFGTRRDAADKFDHHDIQLIQFGLTDALSDEEAFKRLEAGIADLSGKAAPLVSFGSGRRIKSEIQQASRRLVLMAAVVAFAALTIAGLGMANVVAANVAARRFEYGVLRSIGATRLLVVRLLIAEGVLIGISACIVGTGFGAHDVWNVTWLYRNLAGIPVTFGIYLAPVVIGSLFVLAVATVASLAPAISVARTTPRALIDSGPS